MEGWHNVTDEKLAALKAYCANIQLSPHSVAAAIDTVKQFEWWRRKKLKTYPQQKQELENLIDKSRGLSKAICSLSQQSEFELFRAMCNISHPTISFEYDEFSVNPDPKQENPIPYDRAIIELTECLEKASSLAIKIIGKKGAKGGRVEKLDQEAQGISCIAFAVLEHDFITPGTGGMFEKLCDAIFEAAGMHSKSEGAIKRFKKNYKDQLRIPLLNAKTWKEIDRFNLGNSTPDKSGN